MKVRITRSVSACPLGLFQVVKICMIYKECLDLDVLWIAAFTPVVSQRVINILERFSPSEFEKFPVDFNIDSNMSFFAINVVNGIKEEDFLSNSLGKLSLCCLHVKDKYGEDASKILVFAPLIDAFKAGSIQGYEHLKYGENPYAVE